MQISEVSAMSLLPLSAVLLNLGKRTDRKGRARVSARLKSAKVCVTDPAGNFKHLFFQLRELKVSVVFY